MGEAITKLVGSLVKCLEEEIYPSNVQCCTQSLRIYSACEVIVFNHYQLKFVLLNNTGNGQ